MPPRFCLYRTFFFLMMLGLEYFAYKFGFLNDIKARNLPPRFCLYPTFFFLMMLGLEHFAFTFGFLNDIRREFASEILPLPHLFFLANRVLSLHQGKEHFSTRIQTMHICRKKKNFRTCFMIPGFNFSRIIMLSRPCFGKCTGKSKTSHRPETAARD